jgi:hypothetical protein
MALVVQLLGTLLDITSLRPPDVPFCAVHHRFGTAAGVLGVVDNE